MRLFHIVAARLRGFAQRDGIAEEIREELRFHFDLRTEHFEREGMGPEAARREARRRMGNLALYQDRGYDVRGGGPMETIWQDVRYAARLLRGQAGFTLVAILTLALGIGASTAVFSVIDAALLRPLPYPDPEQLVELDVEIVRPDGTTSSPTPSMEDVRFWQGADDVFSAVVAWGAAFRGQIADGPEPERLEVLQITDGYLAMHGVTPLVGRDVARADAEFGAPQVALLGYGHWQRRFGGREDVIGETIRLDTGVATVIGVLPSWFNPRTPVTSALQIDPKWFARRGTGRVNVYARLRPGVTIEQAEERVSARMAGAPSPDGSLRPVRVRVGSRIESLTSTRRTTVNVIAGAVGLILLIACVNVAGLLLARGSTRQAEIAVRASLGAGRARIIRQLVTESLLLAALGGGAGILLAWLTLDAIVANIPISLSANAPAAVSVRVLAAATALLLSTVLLFGLAPAIRLSRVSIGSDLSRGRRQAGTPLSRRGSQLLVAVEVALAVVLVAGAGLMLRSFARLSAVDLGFDPDGLTTMEVLPLDRDADVHRTYYTRLVAELRGIGGVESVGLVDNFVLGGGTAYTGLAAGGEPVFSSVFGVLPGYLETIGARLRHGRWFSEADYSSRFRGVILNETAARALFPEGDAVNRPIVRDGSDRDPWTVIGVVSDLRHGGPLNARGENFPQGFFPFEPTESDFNQAKMVVLRTPGRIPDLGDRLRRTAQSIGPRALVERIRTANEWFGDRVVTPRRRTVLLGLLGGLGLLLALVGVFGMTAYAVSRRTSEIGVRMAFGARPGQVVGRMLRDSAVPIAIGTAIGLGAAALATRIIRSFLFQTDPIDPPTFAAVAIVLLAAGGLAAWVPARRAARVDPILALRAE